MLRIRFADRTGFAVHEADALDFDWSSLARKLGAPLRLIGNLPYNISTPLLFRLLAAAPVIRDMHFMLQKEVVDRIVADPGSRNYGRLTVMLAPRVSAARLLDVGAARAARLGAVRDVWESGAGRFQPAAQDTAQRTARVPDGAADERRGNRSGRAC
jgi:ribosomal RNA adenine dimethylase